MSRLVNLARAAAEKPTEAVEYIIGVAVLLVGLWFVSPFYEPSTSIQSQIWENAHIPRYTGAVQALVAATLLFALVRKKWTRRQTVRRQATFAIFVLYLFYGFSSTVILGMGRVSWIATFALALISGVAHLRLKWEEGEANARN
ncbi:membrane protein [Streptomyces phage Forrest]|nr:membrane protein [Streptomyces phage Forrest]QZE11520.1 membrane protein [Streptomyces phage Jada]